jgi:DNA polymerase I
MRTSPTSSNQPAADHLLIVDAHCYAYRAFFGMGALHSPTGQPTNAIYGFIRMLAKIQERLGPSHVLVVWDGGLAEHRTTLLPEYKEHRAEMPADMSVQLDQIVEYLRAARITSWVKDGCEADDFIAAATLQSVAVGLPVVIASSDKDFMQLVSENVKLLVPHDKSENLWDIEQVALKTGVKPTQVVDWLSLVGDAVDNIPGVRGVGPKTATDLLRQFGSVEVMYQSLNEVKSDRIRAGLLAAEGQVRRNLELIRLKTDMCPAVFSLEELAVKEVDAEELRRLYSRWGFKKMLANLEETLLKTGDLFHENAHAI